MPLLADLADGFVDLVLGSSCVVCGRPGRALCVRCCHELPVEAGLRRPTPCPPGLAPSYSAGPYDGVLRALVLAHKEHGVHALAGPLGTVLAVVADAALSGAGIGPDEAVVLVPVPSRPAAVRARGHDPTTAMTRAAASGLRSRGHPVGVAGLLRVRPGVVDQAGLDAASRAANLAGSMATSTSAVRRLARRRPTAHVLLCDDVLTTGATLREAQRALESVGIRVLAAATVAATRRKIDPPNLG
ncbi:hypothetical protein ASE01_23565 [Nocardioides sp. Root190]|uniref:ComF family protein n=1 Tax=Nocardioides sp. Root190 TaxID=1736488 RepID=UPI0006FE8E7F|nr:phosphoribosyltransferase family protein [Nocardioides sp. Root190]KRB79288.1 hypothetical protein ASE01_23565 [Nocardioides sp. Root190]